MHQLYSASYGTIYCVGHQRRPVGQACVLCNFCNTTSRPVACDRSSKPIGLQSASVALDWRHCFSSLFFFSKDLFFFSSIKIQRNYKVTRQGFRSTWLGIQLKIEPFPSNLLWPCSSQDLVDVLIVILSVNSSCGDFAFKLKPCMQKMLQYYSAGGSLSPEILHVE